MTQGRLTYRFGPLERRGLLGPIRVGQAAVLAAGGLVAIIALDHSPTGRGAIVATICLAVAIALAVVPLGRRTVEEWAPVVFAFLTRRVLRRARFHSPVPSLGFRAREQVRGLSHAGPSAPPAVRHVRIL